MHIAVGNDGEVLRAYTAESIDLDVTSVYETEHTADFEAQSQGL